MNIKQKSIKRSHNYSPVRHLCLSVRHKCLPLRHKCLTVRQKMPFCEAQLYERQNRVLLLIYDYSKQMLKNTYLVSAVAVQILVSQSMNPFTIVPAAREGGVRGGVSVLN